MGVLRGRGELYCQIWLEGLKDVRQAGQYESGQDWGDEHAHRNGAAVDAWVAEEMVHVIV